MKFLHNFYEISAFQMPVILVFESCYDEEEENMPVVLVFMEVVMMRRKL
jgi:hypothetical protein